MNQLFFAFIFSVSISGMAQAAKLGIACLNNGIPSVDIKDRCYASLPKCEDILYGANVAGAGATNKTKGLIDTVKNQLSWKLKGYYEGIDIDLNKSSLNPNGRPQLVGGPTTGPICSVVGQKLQVSAQAGGLPHQIPDAEIVNQIIPPNGPCGKRPVFVKKGGKNNFDITYYVASEKNEKDAITAQLRGAYVWVVRKMAYDVLSKINVQSVGSLNSILKNVSESSAAVEIIKQTENLDKLEQKLATEDKASCKVDKNSTSAIQCENVTITDPAQKICSLQKTRSVINVGAYANLIVYEIMDRAEKYFRRNFSSVFFYGELNRLGEKCSNEFKANIPFSLPSDARLSSCVVSCFAGEFGESNRKNWYCVDGVDDGAIPKPGFCNAESFSKASCYIRAFPKIGDTTQISMSGSKWKDGAEVGIRKGPTKTDQFTVNSGIAGMIESKIRNMCGQTTIYSKNVCDSIGISATPEEP